MKIRKAMTLLLSILLVCQCACAKIGGKVNDSTYSGNVLYGGETKYYSKSRYDSTVSGDIWDIYVSDGTVFILSLDEGDYLISADSDGERSSYFHYLSQYQECYLLAIAGDEENIWLAESTFVICEDEDENSFDEIVNLKCMSYSGECVMAIPLNDLDILPEDDHTVYDILIDKDGTLLLHLNQRIAVLEPDGTVRCVISIDEHNGLLCNLIRDNEGNGVAVFAGKNYTLRKINSKSGMLTDEYKTNFEDSWFYNGFGEYFLTAADENGYYGLKADGSTYTIMLWADSKLEFGSLSSLEFYSNGSFLALDGNNLYTLTESSQGASQKKRLTIASFSEWGNNIDWIVSLFNQNSDEYYVEIINYCEQLDYDNAVKKLNSEIVAGNAPDIFILSNLSPMVYENSEFLLDMYDFIDADESISRDDFMILDKLERDGSLYMVTPAFVINSYYGLASQFGDRFFLGFDEYLSLDSELNEDSRFFYYTSMDDFLETSMIFLTGDLSNGLNTVALKKTLATAKNIGEKYYTLDLDSTQEFASGAELLAQGQIMLESCTIESIRSIIDANKEVGQKLSYIGWPTVDETCGSYIMPYELLGINAQSENSEGAWEFIKYCISDGEVQKRLRVDNLPIQKSMLETAIELAYRNEDTINNKELEEELLFNLIDEISIIYCRGDTVINDIVMQNAQAYFTGDKELDDVVNLIESTVNLYLGENS